MFSLSLTIEMLGAEICQSRHFSKGVGHFRRTFDREGALTTNQCWCQKTRVIAVSCGIRISAVHYLVVTIHASDRQTDRQTELRQQYRLLHYMQSHGKN